MIDGNKMNTLDIKKSFQQLMKKKSVKFGLPFFSFCVLGSFGLKEFAELRYKYRRTNLFHEKAVEKGLELKDKKELTLEAEYENIKKYNLDDWENKRIARPWEE
ncbi:hypothetical protein PV325_005982 [Microctonus aethiopoides]|uniref:Cytochrome c oxidase assembly protein COX16 homolog, mitochondrial n=1 Tax=Microctonus aethiopoides TaxID=144406 RepID=A0AA39KRI3_9HYME|nr:hypothetical protein PV325_005982 [Microctonus aethiopoides]KAK0096303.1 hypothetical protein PV326_005853 [Microctonus aethiopoides]KAK0170921.1 hypothetical protein PV328_008699 [Microctonus aethiopoides]